MDTNLKQGLDTSDRLTTTEFWDSAYQNRELIPFDDSGWKNYCIIQVVRLIESLGLETKKICEVGGGDAQVTCHLAKKYPGAFFSVLDFSPKGCELAHDRAKSEGVKLDVIKADLFSPLLQLDERFDLVVSQGVVEHFMDLADVMRAKRKLINDQGQLFTLIPNFESPIYTYLCKRWSLSVFEDHVPHTMSSFIDGHRRANLNVIESGYLGSIEFGMLSMAMTGPEKKTKFDRFFYLWLTRLSKVIHYIEYKTVDFSGTRLFSPYIYAISQKEL